MCSQLYYVVFILLFIYCKTINGLKETENIVSKNTTKPTIDTSLSSTTTTTNRPLLPGFRLPCSCVEGQCGCCTGYILDRFNQKGCFNVSYEPDDFAISASMTMNGKVLYKNTISGKNPPPVCVRLPRLQFIRFCVEFSNIYIAQRNIHLCMNAEANWEDITLIEWSFDCIRMGVSGVAVVGPEEGGGLPSNPIDAVDQTDEDYDDSARDNYVKPNYNDVKLIFNSNIRKAAKKVPNKNLINVKKLSNDQYFISYNTDE